MTGVSPGGLLTFVSKAYGGRTSDKHIFEESGIINLLEPHIDGVIVDKGFLIDEICGRHFIKLVRPSFQRLRLFQILNTPVAWSLVRHIDNIIIVCSGIVNLQNPLFSEEKFG